MYAKDAELLLIACDQNIIESRCGRDGDGMMRITMKIFLSSFSNIFHVFFLQRDYTREKVEGAKRRAIIMEEKNI